MEVRSLLVLVALLVTLVSAPHRATAQPAASAEKTAADPLGEEIGRAVLKFNLGGWWGQIVVVRNGKVILAKGYGVANEDLTPMTADSLIDVGDLAKQFTAVGALRLEQLGKLSVDEGIGRFFPEAPEAARAITLRQILSNTSGLSDRVQLSAAVDDMDREKLVAAVLQSQLQHEPGKVFEYCNRAFCVAAAIIEKASGKPYDEFMREEIFKPAGMTSTGFIDGVGLDANRRTERLGALRVGTKKAPLFAPSAAGGWSWARRGTTGAVSCGRDLAKWEAVLQTDLVLNQAERAKMLTPVQESYGLGVYIHTTPRVTRRVWHGGFAPGYKTLFVSLANESTTMIVMTNEVGEPDAIMSVIETLLFPPLPEGAKGTLNVNGLQYRQDVDGFVLEEKIKWVATPLNDGGVELSMYRAGNSLVMASLALSEGTARRCLASLTDNLRFFNAEDPRPTITTIIVGKQAVPQDGTLHLDSIFKVEMRSAYRGRNKDGSELNDRRPTLLVVDASGIVPLIVRMDHDAAEEMRAQLTTALKLDAK